MQARPGDPGTQDPASPGRPGTSSHRPGTVLAGRYRLDEPRAAGLPGAERWSATDQILARPVTVTLVAGERTSAVLDAARRAALVVDPRLARILDVGTADGTGYVVTAATEGRSLAALAAGAPLAADQARAVVGEVAAALEVARRRGVHHLALRPESVLVTPSGRVVLEGLAVDGELIGAAAGGAHAMSRADTVGLVRVLYAALTGRWPGSDATGGAAPLRTYEEWSAARTGAPDGHGPLAAGLPDAPLHEGAPLPPVDLVGTVPADLDTLCAVTLGPHDDGPHSPAELVRELEPWRAVRADEIFRAADAGRWPALQPARPGAGAPAPTAPPTGSDPMSDDQQHPTSRPAEQDAPRPTGAGAAAAGAAAGGAAGTGAVAAGAAGPAGAGAAGAGAAAAAAATGAGAAGGVARQSVRSAFGAGRQTAGRRPGTPPPADPAPASFPPAARQPRTSTRATPAAAAPGPTETTPAPTADTPAAAPADGTTTPPAIPPARSAAPAEPAAPAGGTPSGTDDPAAARTEAAPTEATAASDPAATAAVATTDAGAAADTATGEPVVRPEALAVAGITSVEPAPQPRPTPEPAEPASGTPVRRSTSAFGRTPVAAGTTTPASGTDTAVGTASAAEPETAVQPAPGYADDDAGRTGTGAPVAASGATAAAGGDGPGRPEWGLPFSGADRPEPSPAERRVDPTRWVLGGVALAVVVGLIIALSTVLRPFGSGDDEPAAAPPAATAPAPAAEEPAPEDPAAEPEAPAAAPPLVAAVSTIDPSDDDGEHEELIGRLVDGDPATTWYTHTYNRPDFAGFKDAVGIVITLQAPATVSAVTLDGTGTGGSVEVRSTDAANPTAGDVLVTSALAAPQTVLTLAQPTETQSIVLWFTSLSQTPDGANKIELSNIALS